MVAAQCKVAPFWEHEMQSQSSSTPQWGVCTAGLSERGIFLFGRTWKRENTCRGHRRYPGEHQWRWGTCHKKQSTSEATQLETFKKKKRKKKRQNKMCLLVFFKEPPSHHFCLYSPTWLSTEKVNYAQQCPPTVSGENNTASPFFDDVVQFIGRLVLLQSLHCRPFCFSISPLEFAYKYLLRPNISTIRQCSHFPPLLQKHLKRRNKNVLQQGTNYICKRQFSNIGK